MLGGNALVINERVRTRAAGIILVLAQGLAGCGGSSSPSAPSAVPQPAPVQSTVPQPAPLQLVRFTETTSGFSTTDVRDLQEQIVQFNTADELIWTPDGTRFPEFLADGNFIGYHHRADHFFQVRFGTKKGERRAYLSWPDSRLHGAVATIVDLWVDELGRLNIAETNVPVP